MNVNLMPLLYVSLSRGNWWFRVGRDGNGLAACDHRIRPPLLSEIYNGQHGFRHKRYIHIGPYCFERLRPLAFEETP